MPMTVDTASWSEVVGGQVLWFRASWALVVLWDVGWLGMRSSVVSLVLGLYVCVLFDVVVGG